MTKRRAFDLTVEISDYIDFYEYKRRGTSNETTYSEIAREAFTEWMKKHPLHELRSADIEPTAGETSAMDRIRKHTAFLAEIGPVYGRSHEDAVNALITELCGDDLPKGRDEVGERSHA